MSGPSLTDIVGIAPAIKALVDKVFAAIEAASPLVATGDEEAIRKAISDAISGIDVASLEFSLASILAAVKSGKSIAGSGADATLA